MKVLLTLTLLISAPLVHAGLDGPGTIKKALIDLHGDTATIFIGSLQSKSSKIYIGGHEAKIDIKKHPKWWEDEKRWSIVDRCNLSVQKVISGDLQQGSTFVLSATNSTSDGSISMCPHTMSLPSKKDIGKTMVWFVYYNKTSSGIMTQSHAWATLEEWQKLQD